MKTTAISENRTVSGPSFLLTRESEMADKITDQIELLEKRLEQKFQDVSASLVKKKSDKIWDLVTKIAIPALVAALGFIWNINQRVVVIEATRVTAGDFQKEIASLNLKLSSVVSDIQKGPEWLRDYLVKLVDNMKEATSKLSERVVKMEVKIDNIK